MDEALMLSTLTGAALTQGVTFIYRQLENLIRGKKDARTLVDAEADAILVGSLRLAAVDPQAYEQRQREIDLLYGILTSYLETAYVREDDAHLQYLLGSVRDVLEDVYKQRITFIGEGRPPSGVSIDQEAEEVRSAVTGLEVQRMASNVPVDVKQKFGMVRENAPVVGAKINEIL
ncbi:hypothetical protein AB0J14_20190 [Micromonospora arborensis]|uniref:hypothetical protein n=1 Tax=Micromonospora arborensis TaxID=2116518 RepID=UPI0033D4EC97